MSAPVPRAPSPLRSALFVLLVLGLDAALLALALGGIRPLLAHARAMVLLATWATGYVALAALRPVRMRDPVAGGRDPGWVIFLLFVVPLLTPPYAAAAERFGLAPLPGGQALRWTGVALSAAGFALRIAAMQRLGSRFSPLVEVQRGHALETRGPYAWVRHPGYLGSSLSNLGVILAFGSAAALPLAVLLGVALEARIRQEERVLESRFGEEFRAYRERTPRLLPRRRPAR